MVNYVYRVHHKTTLCCSNVILLFSLSLRKCLYTLLLKLHVTLLLEPPQTSCDIDIPPVDCFSCFIFLMFCVYAMCDCRPLLPVLARTLEEMFKLMMIIIFKQPIVVALHFQMSMHFSALNNSKSHLIIEWYFINLLIS